MKTTITSDMITKEDVTTLITSGSDPSISMFMPTHRAGAEIRQDPIRFKGLLQDARRELRERDYPGGATNELLKPFEPLIDDQSFWEHQADGLAVFLSAERSMLYRIPVSVEDLLVVGDVFHIKPLLPALSGPGKFYILALSQGGSRLLEATRYGVRQRDIPDLAKDLDEALPTDDPEKQHQWHTETSYRPGKRAAIHHGQGLPKDDTQHRKERYCRFVNKTVADALKDGNEPLLLAAEEHTASLYREINSYEALLDEQIEGNVEHLSNHDLWQKCLRLVETLITRSERDAVQRYQERAQGEGASSDLQQIAFKAVQGAVDTLIVEIHAHRWGRYDSQTSAVDEHPIRKPGDRDLLDAVAGQVLLQGGQVIALKREDMPDDAPLGAIFRF